MAEMERVVRHLEEARRTLAPTWADEAEVILERALEDLRALGSRKWGRTDEWLSLIHI